jgi:hypothetical protein
VKNWINKTTVIEFVTFYLVPPFPTLSHEGRGDSFSRLFEWFNVSPTRGEKRVAV